MRRHALVAGVVTAVALVAHAWLSRSVAGGDVLAALLRDRDIARAALLLTLLAVRLWLFAFAPGWLLYLAARALIQLGLARARR